MQILFNAVPLLTPLTGIGQYVHQLFTQLQAMPDNDIYAYYITHVEHGVRSVPTLASSPVENAAPPRKRSSLSKRALLGILTRLPMQRQIRRVMEKRTFRLFTGKFAQQNFVYHEPNFCALPYDGPTVVTVCDLSCFDHPETHPKERVKVITRDLPRSLRQAERVIVISDFTRDRLRAWFDVPEEKIVRTYLAADPRFRVHEADELANTLAALNITPGSYVLSVGTLEPRKNLTTLFQAFSRLPAELRRRYPLLVAGKIGWHEEELMHSARDLVSRGEIRFLGYVEDAFLPALTAGAALMVYPSLYEGFGLPPLEAMSSGVPVVVANTSSLPEVVGDAAWRVEANDVAGFTLAIQTLLEDQALAQQQSQAGLVRAAQFSWQRCAQETQQVYHQALEAYRQRVS